MENTDVVNGFIKIIKNIYVTYQLKIKIKNSNRLMCHIPFNLFLGYRTKHNFYLRFLFLLLCYSPMRKKSKLSFSKLSLQSNTKKPHCLSKWEREGERKKKKKKIQYSTIFFLNMSHLQEQIEGNVGTWVACHINKTVSHINFFHLSLNNKDHFDRTTKGWGPI